MLIWIQISWCALIIGFLIDLIVGDPHSWWHPIYLVGKLIEVGEKGIRRIMPKTDRGEFIGGILLVILVAGLTTLVPVLILVAAHRIHPLLHLVVESLMCYWLLATKCLKDESMEVYDELKKGDIAGARHAVSMIVGRDTERLDETGVTKAAVETVAENTSDGILAPMIFIAVGGAGLGWFYKAVNTMDSMVGYKNEKYRHFGTCAAILDDVLNYIPARISAYLMILATVFVRMDTGYAYKIYRRDRYNHASPNSAHTEAVMAGALKVQLAGDAWYFGKLLKKKTIGDAVRPVQIEDIRRANRLLYATSILSLLLLSLIKGLILAGVMFL